MAISEIPIFSMLRTRLHWHQERQRLLAENIANSDTPGFRPQDLSPPSFGSELAQAQGVRLAQTNPAHFSDAGGNNESFRVEKQHFAVRPTGNAVHLEDEMMKVAANQMDYQAASALYARSLALIKLALGKSG
jgi:flagellar basal-body rod protein FlgB